MDAMTVFGYVLLAGGVALLLTRWRLTKTAGVVLCYVAGTSLTAHMPGGTVHNLVDTVQDAFGGWDAVPTVLAVIAFVVVAWSMFSGGLSLLTGALALALPTLLPYLAGGPLNDLWHWWTSSTEETVDGIRGWLGQSVQNAKPPTR
jgi:hypothetical protein